MRLERITIHRMPGINDKFTLDGFAEGLNLVVGSNGSGKTTVCRAVRAMLWPDPGGPDPISVEAVWEDGSTTWLSMREGKQGGWQRDGSDSPGPSLPGTRAAHCYTLGLRDLLLSESPTDDEIAREILTRMAGGFDIRNVRDNLFSFPKRSGKSEADAVRSARDEVRTLQEAQRALLTEESSLQELEAQQRAAAAAGAKVTILDFAAEYTASQAELAGVMVTLSTFPDGMDKVSGDEFDRLNEIREEIRETEKQREASQRRINAHGEAITDAGFPEGEVDEADINVVIEGARGLKGRVRDLADAKVKLAGVAAKRDEAAQSLKTVDFRIEPEVAPDTGPEAMAAVDNYLRNAAALRAEKEAYATERSLFSGDHEEGQEGRKALYEQAISALRKWLAASSASGQTAHGRKSILPGVLVALAGAAVAFFGYQAAEPLLLMAGAAAAGAGLVLLVGPHLGTRLAVDDTDRHRNDYMETGLPEPSGWEPGAVQGRLNELTAEWQRAALSEEKATHLERLEALEQKTEARKKELAAVRENVCRQFGIDPQVTDLDLYLLAGRIKTYLDADAAVKETTAEVEALDKEVENTLASLNGKLEALGSSSAADSDGVQAAAEDIKSRNAGLKQAVEGKRLEESNLQELEDTLARHRRRIEGVYTGAGVSVNDDEDLTKRVTKRDAYKDAEGRKAVLKQKTAELEARLAGHEELLELSVEDVEMRRQEASDLSSKLTNISETIGRIREKVRDARQSSELEEALATADAAADTLNIKREETLLKIAGDFLLNKVMGSYEYEARPPVLDRTSRLFERFTAHQYEVFLDAEDAEKPRFRAIETGTGKGKALSELSDATRMQLLLAARLAYIEEVEEGMKLPLFLDEVLTTSDPVRFAAIAESLMAMAEEGRQVFYLGANPADTVWWEQTLRSKGLDPPVPIDLDKVRSIGKVVTVPAELELPEPSTVPEPGTMTPEEYGVAIEVTRLDPEQPVNSMHLFHLLRDDLNTLYEILQGGLKNVGQWRSMTRSGSANALFDEATVKQVSTVADAAEAFLDAWHVGRGRRVDMVTLEDADVTPTFLKRLPTLVEEVGGDARRLLDVIDRKEDERVKGFRANSRESLEQYLRENGYLDDQEVLSKAEIFGRVLVAVSAAVEAEYTNKKKIERLISELNSSLESTR